MYIFTGTQATPENIRKFHPNLIVNATGFGPLLPPINGLMDNIDKEGGSRCHKGNLGPCARKHQHLVNAQIIGQGFVHIGL